MRLPFFSSSARGTRRATRTETDWNLVRWTLALYLCIGLTGVIILSVAIWGVSHDLDQVRATLVESEMDRLRSHAERTVMLIQDDLVGPLDDPKADYSKLQKYLRRHWERSVLPDESRLYSAVVLPHGGKVFLHSNPAREGQSLRSVWYDRMVPEAGENVVETRAAALTGGERALDVRVPIMLKDQLEPVGEYHTGLNYAWFEHELAARQAPSRRAWTWIMMAILLAVLIAGVALFQISRRIAVMREAIKLGRARRFAEVGQLMAGLAHEIRNPLNAMRLNLHVLTRSLRPGAALAEGDPEETVAIDQGQILRETNQEIERVEGLMRVMLGYARPDQPQTETLDLRQVLESTLNFLRPVLERSEVAVRARFADQPVYVRMDRERLRQILINLIGNARDATGPGGQIQVDVATGQDEVEVLVADDGPGVPGADRERIFEPFYSTKENGTGLGLALVRRYMEECGGTVTCEAHEPRGACFHLTFHRVVDPSPIAGASFPSSS